MNKYKTILEFLDDQEPKKLDQIERLRAIILNLGFELEESIKWNAPNYRYKGIDRITFNLINKDGKVKIVIHTGTSKKEDKNASPVLKESSGIIVWNSNIRGTISFDALDDINNKEEQLKCILTKWLKLELNSISTHESAN